MENNKKQCIIYNDEFMKEWDWDKNYELGLDPYVLTEGSGKKTWWICERGHEYDVTPKHKSQGYGCPYCSGRRVLKGFNDLATTHPDIASEWNYDKNDGLLPTQVTHGSTKKVWWICRSGHEFNRSVNNRTSRKYSGMCPFCKQEMQTSFPEQVIYFYFKQITNAKSRENIFGEEVDIFLPEYKSGIEYDGKRFHNSINSLRRERKKDDMLSRNGVNIIRIKESYDNYIDNNIVYYKQDVKYTHLKWAIEMVFELLKITNIPKIDLDRDRISIYSQYIDSKKDRSLLALYPDIAKQWNYDKNGSLKPEFVTSQSRKKVWWICDKGHEWEATISNRVNGRGCPVCLRKKVVAGINDLATSHPNLVSEWDTNKNIIAPTEVSSGSSKKVWWKCKDCGYEWQTAVHVRAKGHGCPKCANIRKGPNKNNKISLIDNEEYILI